MSRKMLLVLIVFFALLAGCKSEQLTAELWIGPVDNRQLVTDQAGEVAQSGSTPFEVRFNQPMDPGSVSPPITIQPAAAGQWIWSEDKTIATFELSSTSRLFANYDYTIAIHPSLLTESGESFEEPPTWAVSTTQLFLVTDRDVQGEGRLVTARITFSLPPERDSVESAVEVNPPLDLDFSWEGDTLIIEPAEQLTPGQRYQFSISDEAMSSSGQSLQSINWSYTSPRLINSIIYPYANHMDNSLRIRFNYPLDWDSATDSIVLDPAVDGSFAVDEDRMEITFQPDTNFRFETTYTLSFSKPLINPDGSVLGSVDDDTFTTLSPMRSVEPQPWSTTAPDTEIDFEFEIDMNHESLQQAFSIDPYIEGVFSGDSRQLVFRPDGGYFDVNTTYTVSIGVNALDSNNQPVFSKPYQFTFSTIDLPEAYFGPYANVLVTYPQPRIEIDFEVLDLAGDSLVFDLYEVTPDGFVARFVEGYRSWGWDPSRGDMWVGEAEPLDQWIESMPGCESDYSQCSHQTSIDGNLPSGLYMLTLSSLEGEMQDQMLMVVTERLVTAKTANGQVTAWVTNHAGVPIPNAEVRVYAENGQFVESGLTDEDGVFQTWVFGGVEPVMVVAEIGDEITVTGLTRNWLTGYSGYSGMFGGRNFGTSQGPVRLLAHIHTDRPIYRPGQTVYFKAILRQDQDALIGLLEEGTPAIARLLDGRDNVIDTLELATNRFGTVNGEFVLAEGAMTGEYTIEIQVDDDTFRQIFKVEDYRKPDYEITMEADRDYYIENDTITLTLDAHYFMDQPVSNAPVELALYAMPYSWWGYEPYPELIRELSESNWQTDEDGLLTIEIDAPFWGDSYGYWYSGLEEFELGVEVTIDDGSNQPVSNFIRLPVYRTDAYVRLRTERFFQPIGTNFTVEMAVVNVEGELLPEQTMHWSLYEDNYYNDDVLIDSGDVQSDEGGEASRSFRLPHGGWYRLTVTCRDTEGRPIESSRYFYAAGWARNYTNRSQLNVTLDQESYTPGDTAEVLIESTFDGPALLTVERGSVRRQEIIELTAPVTIVELPVQTGDTPNAYVRVAAWAPINSETESYYPVRTYGPFNHFMVSAYDEMVVPAVGKVLEVSIVPEQSIYAPGDQAVFDIHVSDYAGRPVQAELSLALVDEAIFALSEELSPPLFEAFYGPRALEILERHTLQVMGYLLYDVGGLGGGGGGPMFSNPRSDFPDTAVWVPTLVTNSQGDARLEITLPDNLTTWRLTARAVTRDHLVGETIETVVTQQPLVLRPHLPRILTEGDQFDLVATLHNYTDDELEVEVGLSATGLNLAGVDKRTVSVPANGTYDVVWTLTAQSAGEARLTFTADGGDVRDALQLSLPIRSLAIRDVQTLSGQIDGLGSMNFDVPQDGLENSTLRVQLSTTVTGGLLDGLEYLTGFPYGCVEQTMSAVLPNAVIGRAFDQLGVEHPSFQADLLTKVNLGLQRLYGLQHQDGGWGWWYDDATHDYQTAWVVFGLTLTREAGFEVDEGVIERGAAWLSENLTGMDPRTQAYALYTLSLAGYGKPHQASILYDMRSDLDPFSLAALAMALHLEGLEDEAGTVVEEIYSTGAASGDLAHWEIGIHDGYYRQKTMASSIRTTALILSALAQIGEYDSDELEPIANWLMSQRDSYGWGTTNETSFAILGLTDFLLETLSADSGGSYQVSLNGGDIGEGEFEVGATSVEFELPAEELLSGENEVSMSYAGDGSLYYLITRTSLLPRAEVESAGTLEIERRYVDPVSGRALASFEPGDLVEVQLTFTLPETMTYLIVEDHLPGGMEALNERLNNVSHVSTPESDFYEEDYSSFFFWMDFGYNYKEIKADRVSFFVTELEAGEYTYTYMARVTHSGNFSAPPAEVYGMYDLEQWGRSTSTIVEVQ